MKQSSVMNGFRKVFWLRGKSETWRLRALFDARWYLAVNSDVAAARVDPFAHYLNHGLKEGRDPNPLFSTRYYLASNPDVQASGVNAIQHYLSFGAKEQRDPHPLFSTTFYLQNSADIVKKGMSPLEHYLGFGGVQGRQPHPLFDVNKYLDAHQTLLAEGTNPLLHYLQADSSNAYKPHELFDSSYYLSRYSDVRAAGINPLVHYLEYGWHEGRQPHPLFDGRWYLNQRPDVRAAGINPLIHYVLYGAGEGADPSPRFNTRAYMAQLSSEELELAKNPLVHYLTRGQHAGLVHSAVIQEAPDEALMEFLISKTSNGRATILMVTHAKGGGVERHVRDLIELAASRVNALIIWPSTDGDEVYCVSDSQQEPGARFHCQGNWPQLLTLLKRCNVQRIHVHHVFGCEQILQRLIEEMDLPTDLTVHDHWMLSETSLPDPEYISPASALALKRWIVDRADRMIVPSADAASRVIASFPASSPIVAPHYFPDRSKEPLCPALQPGRPLRVGILGVLAPHKGRTVVVDTAKIASERRLPLRFIVIGEDSFGEPVVPFANLEFTGRYAFGDVQDLILRAGLHVLWFPTQVPETYSYTLSEGLASGLPILAPNLGAFPERLAGRHWTWIRDWDALPEEWARLLMEVRNGHILVRREPIASETPIPVASEFYPEGYLSWIE